MNSDLELQKLLKSWQVEVRVPTGFRASVWGQIEQARENPLNRWLEKIYLYFIEALAQPRYALAVILLFVSLGFFLGTTQDQHYSAKMKARYVQSIDPYAHSHGMEKKL